MAFGRLLTAAMALSLAHCHLFGAEEYSCQSHVNCPMEMMCCEGRCLTTCPYGDPGGGPHGDTTAGDPMTGDPLTGDPVPGDPVAGDPVAGDPVPGDPIAGDPLTGDPLPGDPGPYDFSVTLPETELHLPRGESRDLEVQIDRTAGFHESVNLEILSLPSGVSTQSIIVPDGQRNATLPLSALLTTPIQSVSVTVRGTSTTLIRDEETLTLFVDGAPGETDTSFGAGGVVTTSPGDDAIIRTITVQPDGRIVAAGDANGDFAVTRYLPDGSLDTSFSNNGMVTTNFGGADDRIYRVLLQPDGDIVALGRGDGRMAAARYLTNGTRDNDFGSGGTVEFGPDPSRAHAGALQADGSIVALGVTGGNDIVVARLTAGGVADTTFGDMGTTITDISGEQDWGSSVAIQTDGRIVGSGFTGTGSRNAVVVRYTSNGFLDSSFGTNGIVEIDATSGESYGDTVLMQPDGNILIQGNGANPDDEFVAIRLLANGTLDSSFGTAGIVTVDFNGAEDDAGDAVLDTNGNMLMVGLVTVASSDDVGVVRLLPDGTLDPTFGTNGRLTFRFDLVNHVHIAIALQPDGRIVVGGSHDTGGDSDFILMRFWP